MRPSSHVRRHGGYGGGVDSTARRRRVRGPSLASGRRIRTAPPQRDRRRSQNAHEARAGAVDPRLRLAATRAKGSTGRVDSRDLRSSKPRASRRGDAAAATWIVRGPKRSKFRSSRPRSIRRDAAAAAWTFRGGGRRGRRRRGCHADIPWTFAATRQRRAYHVERERGRVAAAPRLPRGSSQGVGRGDAAAIASGSRQHRSCRRPRRHHNETTQLVRNILTRTRHEVVFTLYGRIFAPPTFLDAGNSAGKNHGLLVLLASAQRVRKKSLPNAGFVPDMSASGWSVTPAQESKGFPGTAIARSGARLDGDVPQGGVAPPPPRRGSSAAGSRLVQGRAAKTSPGSRGGRMPWLRRRRRSMATAGIAAS